MALHVSYCIYFKMARKNYVWRDKKGLGGNPSVESMYVNIFMKNTKI